MAECVFTAVSHVEEAVFVPVLLIYLTHESTTEQKLIPVKLNYFDKQWN